VSFGNDGDFSERALVNRMNSDLANDLGNLLHRTLQMIETYRHGIVPICECGSELSDVLPTLMAMYDESMTDCCNITVIATGLEDALATAQPGKFSSSFSNFQTKPVQPTVKPSAGLGLKPTVTPGVSVNNGPKMMQGLQGTTGLKSNVEDRTLKIPDFLQKK